MDTKGFSSDIFRWVLGMIAGAVILLFFVRFAYQHSTVSTTLQQQELLQHLHDQLTALGASESSTQTISLPKNSELSLDCRSLSSTSAYVSTPHIIFSPSSLRGDTLQVATTLWRYPFPVAPLYYLSTGDIRYVFVYDDATFPFVSSFSFPSLFRSQTLHVRQFDFSALQRQHASAQRLVLVFFTSIPSPSSLLSSRQPPIDLFDVDLSTSTITYQNTREHFTYLTDELLIGAILAPLTFSCQHDVLLERLHSVASIYASKARLLRQKTPDAACLTFLSDAESALETFTTSSDAYDLRSAHDSLEQSSLSLEKHGCPSLF